MDFFVVGDLSNFFFNIFWIESEAFYRCYFTVVSYRVRSPYWLCFACSMSEIHKITRKTFVKCEKRDSQFLSDELCYLWYWYCVKGEPAGTREFFLNFYKLLFPHRPGWNFKILNVENWDYYEYSKCFHWAHKLKYYNFTWFLNYSIEISDTELHFGYTLTGSARRLCVHTNPPSS